MKHLGLLLILLLIVRPTQADELHTLYDSVLVKAMGGVATSTALGTDALYLNPAGLAAQDSFEFQMGNVTVDGSTSALDQFATYSALLGNSATIASLQKVEGIPIFAKTQTTPTVLMSNLGIGIIYDIEAYQYTSNASLPQSLIGAQITYGLQLGYGKSFFFGGAGGKRHKQASELRVGMAAKMLYRRGGYFILDPVDYFGLTDYMTLLKQKTGGYGFGTGVDLGTQFIQPMGKRLKWQSGIAITDIGDTSFTSAQASPIRQNLSIGTGLVYDTGGMRLSLAYDMRNITQITDPRQRNHLGAEIKIPMFSLYAGINQVSYTYGIGVDVWVARITAAYYSQELGVQAGALQDSRYALNCSAKISF